MAKSNKISSAYQGAINKRVPIMLGLIGLMIILFCSAFFTTTYIGNKPNPLSQYDADETVMIEKTTIEWLNENKFGIEYFNLGKFYLEDNNGPVEDGRIEYRIKLGNKKDSSIVGDNIVISTYACYAWANQEFKTSTSTVTLRSSQKTYSATNIDATFDKRPFFFKSVDLRDDVYFVTIFQVKEEGNEKNTLYVVEHDFKDLVVSANTENYTGTSFQK